MTRTDRGQHPRDGSSWYRIKAQADGPALVYLHDLIGGWGISAADFIRDLNAVTGPVDVHINSDGGDVFDAYAIYNALLARPGVTTIVDGLAASSASVIAMAGERRLAARTSQLMVHDAWAGVDGNAADLQRMIGRLETVSGQIAQVYADTAGGSAEFWRGQMQAETWFTAQQAVDAGLLTGLTASAREPAPAGYGAEHAAARAGAIVAAGSVPCTGWDADGDGDDDSCPVGDTNHSHWADDGTQKKSVPGRPMPGQPPAPEIPGEAPIPGQPPGERPTPNSAVQTPIVAWDGPAAMAAASASDDPAAALAAICAGRRAGDPKTQAAYALPHHAHPGDPPDPAGTRNALSRLPQTQGLTNAAAAKAHLEAHMKTISPGDQAAAQSTGRNGMDPTEGALTIEGRRTRITDIDGRLTEVAAAYPAAELPAERQAEWDQLVAEKRDHKRALAAVEARNADLAEIHAANGNSHDTPRPQANGNGNGATPLRAGFGAPAAHIRGDIYDLGAIRQQARSQEDLPGLYKENALRAIDEHRFPGSHRETAQANAASLLDTIADDTTGWVARRILATGSPAYSRVFGKALAAGRPPTGGRDAEILALGESDTGAFAVPFQLDPTVILTSNGAINPLRQISRVERITGKEFDLVTSTGVTVSRKAEFAAETSVAPVLAQPTLQPKRVSAWIPFSVELEGDWTGLQASMMALLSDAKDVEESSSFTNGPGTGVTAGGVVALQAGGSLITLTGGVATLSFKDPETLESAMAPRFRNTSAYLASKTTFNKYRNLFAAQTGFATDPWNRPSLGQPRQLWGYDAYEDSDMVVTNATGDKVILMGDFGHGFLIVDRVGMNVELVPTVFGAAQGNFPTGTRGYFAWWRNNSTVLIPNAFRLGVVG